MNTSQKCFDCGKPLSPEKAERIGFQNEDEAEVIHTFCRPCAKRFVKALVAHERKNNLTGVLKA